MRSRGDAQRGTNEGLQARLGSEEVTKLETLAPVGERDIGNQETDVDTMGIEFTTCEREVAYRFEVSARLVGVARLGMDDNPFSDFPREERGRGRRLGFHVGTKTRW